MSAITTHVLDTAEGRPAAGVPVKLEMQESAGWKSLGQGRTDADGRLRDLLPADALLQPGQYRITFDTATYFHQGGIRGFFPEVEVRFQVDEEGGHYHVPLLLSPFGYSTYRGN